MRFSMNKKTFLAALLLLIVFQLIGNLSLSLSFNKVILTAKVTKLKYIVFNWLENQLYLFKIIEDKSIPNLDLRHDNQLKCSMPMLDHMDMTAVEHLNADFNKLHTLFEACPLTNNSYHLDALINISYDSENLSTFKIQLRMDLILRDYPHNGDSLVCSNWYMDKKINVSEETNELEYGTEFLFTQNNNWTLSTGRPGYYFVKCGTLFEFVYTVLPWNMSALMERRKVFQEYERLAVDAVKTSPLIKDAEFEECQSSSDTESKEKRMNVLMIGLDSISSVHFKRVFPLTLAELEQTKGNYLMI